MRLTPEHIAIIRQTTQEVFGPHAQVRLFGSRLDEAARGGDIDLLVESAIPIPQPERKRLQLVARLQIRLGDQPIDMLLMDPHTVHSSIHVQDARQSVGRAQDVPDNFIPPNTRRYSELRAVSRRISAHRILGNSSGTITPAEPG